jgi:hypothetical protein
LPLCGETAAAVVALTDDEETELPMLLVATTVTVMASESVSPVITHDVVDVWHVWPDDAVAT